MSAHEQGSDAGARPHSIDLTLELERQLDNESNPNSPADAIGPHSLDPHVLASIITQLRASLADVTRERDELLQTVTERRAREAGAADTMQDMVQKCSKMQEELDSARTKIQDDENTISILRTKVEESRRGLMRLQSEKRASQVPSTLDLSRISITGSSGPPSSKRASFNPLTGSVAGRTNAHRRISSVSDSSYLTSPTPTSFTLPDAQKNRAQQPVNARRLSGMFGRPSPPQSLYPSEDSTELDALRQELNVMKAELDEVKHELNESNEALEASDTCVKALREFIEENQVGVVPKGPRTLAEEERKAAPVASGWGFKLWRAESNSNQSPVASLPHVSHAISPSLSSLPPIPLTKKLGDFFGARAGTASNTLTPPPAEQEPMYNGLSDTSSVEDSVAEPISPSSERPRLPVYVRDTTSVTSGSSRDINTKFEGRPLSPDGDFAPVAI